MHLHVLGVCGTFMGSLAQLAKAMGHKVTGSDANVYPPMSTQLERAGIELIEGFAPETLSPRPDLVIVGNVISRGNPAMEAVLNLGVPYISGPQWIAEQWLHKKWVLAVSGTHGKTTTASMLAWILEYAGFNPGFLIGGVPGNFDTSARLGESDFFIIEADEYDTAFFDKRAKFVHYRPRTLIIGNVEFDHADIYPNIEAIHTQFHHLLRMLPGDGSLVAPVNQPEINAILEKGFWSQHEKISTDFENIKLGEGQWRSQCIQADGSEFNVAVHRHGNSDVENTAHVVWPLTGEHNVANATAAIAAARTIGIAPKLAGDALCEFKGVKRRMEVRANNAGIMLYDDFAHHPTAISLTLEGLRKKVGDERILAVIEPRSNTMKMGVHNARLEASAHMADHVFWFDEGRRANLCELIDKNTKQGVFTHFDTLVDNIKSYLTDETLPINIVVMSNGGFNGIHSLLADWINNKN